MAWIWEIFVACLAFMGIASIGALSFAMITLFMECALGHIDYILDYIKKWKR